MNKLNHLLRRLLELLQSLKQTAPEKRMFTKEDKDRNLLIGMKYLVGLKWTPNSAAAIMGNLCAESYLNPETGRGDGGTAMGLAQWRGDRLEKFTKIIGKHCEKATFQEQLKFVDWELRNTEKRAGAKLKEAVSLEDKTFAVDKYYERSAGHHLERRVKFAKSALAMFEAK